MSTNLIFGGWSTPRNGVGSVTGPELQDLWHCLAAHPGEPNFGLTQRKAEIISLWQLYRTQMPNVVLEIGTAQGGTFAGWCYLGHPEATIISIDRCVNDARPRPGDPGNPLIYSGPLASTSNGGGVFSMKRHNQNVVAINGWSYEDAVIEKLKRTLNGRKVDFLFHDASHEAQMFKRDFEIYWPFVAEGGVFASHDIMPHPSDAKCNKSETWREICETVEYSARFEFLGSRHDEGMGIGVLIK